jgi:hypothetical protein
MCLLVAFSALIDPAQLHLQAAGLGLGAAGVSE